MADLAGVPASTLRCRATTVTIICAALAAAAASQPGIGAKLSMR